MQTLEQLLQHKQQRTERLSNIISEEIVPILNKNRCIVLEIGCGHGHFLSAYAKNFQDRLCIGVDIIGERLDRCNRKKLLFNIENLFFFKSEAVEFINIFAKFCKINEIFVLFPDPWPKNKHRKNRLFQVEFLQSMFERNVSKIYLRSDSENYITWTKQQLQKVSNLWEFKEICNLPFECETFFQKIHPQFFTLEIIRNQQ